MKDHQSDIKEAEERIREKEKHLNQIKGCMFGGAVGDALGYPVEFMKEDEIFDTYGPGGITEYELDPLTHQALISDDTQMSLFTANGLLAGDTRGALRGIRANPSSYVACSYQDWLRTQELNYEDGLRFVSSSPEINKSWLSNVKDLYSTRAPGTTCLSALWRRRDLDTHVTDFIRSPLNNSKGCGGIMRVAPLALDYDSVNIEILDLEGAQIAAITHGNSLGYMPAAVLTHIINRIVYGSKTMTLKEIIIEARNTIEKLFQDDIHLEELTSIIDMAVEFSENNDTDLNNIYKIGQGWVAEETLGIAIYCALRYQNDFNRGVIAAVNHSGDSDSTGAVTGNILGALLGYDAIEEKWISDLELKDVIEEISIDLCHGCQMSEYSSYQDEKWERKYIAMCYGKEQENEA